MKPDLRDAVAFGGLALAAVGAWWFHPAAVLLVLGAGLFTLGIWVMR